MKKTMYLLLSVFLFACAGNPPAWWNPSGRYSQDAAEVAPATSSTSPASLAPQQPIASTPTEETFTPEEAVFEEMNLTAPSAQSLKDDIDALQPSVLEE